MEPVAKWDAQHVLVRDPLTQPEPLRPHFTGAEQYPMASHDIDDHAKREGGQDNYHTEELKCWGVRPTCPNGILDGTGGSFAHFPRPEIADSWRCESATSRLVGLSCPTLDARNGSSGSESDASLDAEVASLTSGRRLGLAYNDARLPVEAKDRAAAATGLAMPTVVSPPSRYGNKESSTLFCLLSPSFSQQQHRAVNWAVTPSPTEGERRQAGPLGSGRDASARSIEVAGEPGVAGHVLGGLWTEEPTAKRQKCGTTGSVVGAPLR